MGLKPDSGSIPIGSNPIPKDEPLGFRLLAGLALGGVVVDELKTETESGYVTK